MAKPLQYNSGGSSVGAVQAGSYPWLWLPTRAPSFDPSVPFDPADLSAVDNLFVDDVANNSLPSPAAGGGYRGELLLFTDFNPGETVGFSGDMDPNSIAGLTKSAADTGSNQAGAGKNFDVGGVSGAEMTGSVVTVLFGDGSSTSAQIAHDGTQSGAVALIGSTTGDAPGLTVNGVNAGGNGTYGGNRPSVVVTGPVGATARVSLVKGFDPTGNGATVASGAITVDALVAARLAAQYPTFPVNNSIEWQHIDAVITSPAGVDLTNSHQGAAFDYVNIVDSPNADDFPGDDVLPIAFVAVIIDANGNPISPVSAPIYLLNSGGPVQ